MPRNILGPEKRRPIRAGFLSHLTPTASALNNQLSITCYMGKCDTLYAEISWIFKLILHYLVQGFLTVGWFGSSPTPPSPPLPTSSCLSFSLFPVHRWLSLPKRGGEGGGRGDKSYDSTKACSTINHSLLSGLLFKEGAPYRHGS